MVRVRKRRYWKPAEIAQLVARYPHEPTAALAQSLDRGVSSIYVKVNELGLHKTAEYLASPAACRLRRGDNVGAAYRYPPGHVPANKGLRRPGWGPGRMKETQFKPGQYPSARWDRDAYRIGALRITTNGELQIRLSDDSRTGWCMMARYAWWSGTGRWPTADEVVRARNGDPHDTRIENLELLTRAENMRRNTILNLPPALKGAIQSLGQFKRRIREREQRA